MQSIRIEIRQGLSLLLSLYVAKKAYSFTKSLFRPAVPGIPYIASPPGLIGWMLGQWPLFVRMDFSEPQRLFCKEAMEREGPIRGSVCQYEVGKGAYRMLVTHPKDLEYIFVKNQKNFVKGKDYDRLTDILGHENLVTLKDESVHAKQRRMVAPAFNPKTLKAIADGVLADQVHVAMKNLESQKNPGSCVVEKVPLDEVFDQVALNVVAEASFKKAGIREGEGGGAGKHFEEVTASLDLKMIDLFIPLSLRPYLLPRVQKLMRHVRAIRRLGKEIMVATKQEKNSSTSATGPRTPPAVEDDDTDNNNNKVLLDHLVDQEELKETALVDHITTFLFAGHDTTSKGLLWTSFLLATNPEKQQLLFEEVCAAVGDSTVPTLDSVKDLKYLNQCIKESLRLWSPIGVIFRNCVEDDVLPYSKHFIPKGHTVVWHSHVSMHLKSVFGEDASDFKPERWESEENKDIFDQCAWMPFLVGKRNCIGKDFAWNELLIVIATLVRRYEICLSEGNELPPRKTLKISVRAKKKLYFDLKKRV